MAIIHRIEIVGYFIGDRRSGTHGWLEVDDRGQVYCSECYMQDVEREFTGVITRKQVRNNVYHVYLCDACGKLITGNDQGKNPTLEQEEILKGVKKATKKTKTGTMNMA